MKTIAVLFGGRSTEHEISIISGIQVLNALDKSKYEVIPIYITKGGEWVRGDESFFNPKTFVNIDKLLAKAKFAFIAPDTKIDYPVDRPSGYTFLKPLVKEKIDVVIPVFHGKYGEDGAIQGLLELSCLPYVGCDVEASAIGMDKIISKHLASSINIPVLPDNWISKAQWDAHPEKTFTKSTGGLSFPVFVKPVHLGSSIAIVKVENKNKLKDALEVAFFYDSKVMIEQALVNCKEANISILGNDPYELSPIEEPISSKDILSFEDKYISGKGISKGMATAKRIIPAKLKKETEEKIKKYAETFFREIGGQGIARIDFLLSKDEKQIYFNEINTMPGSLAFYLWEKKGLPMNKLLDKLIDLAIVRRQNKDKLITTFKSNVLQGFSGAKGSKF